MKYWIVSIFLAIVIIFTAIFACIIMLKIPELGAVAFIIIMIAGISTMIHDRFYS